MEKYFNFGSANIYYSVAGNGETIVLIHGFAEDGTIWNEQVPFLEKHCRLIVPDLPGSGQSQMLPANAGIEDYAECLNALLEHEGVDKCIVLGHSMGGYITLALAEAYKDKLSGFGFIHSTAFADNEEKKATRKKGIRFIEEHGAYTFIKNTTPNLFSNNFKNAHLNVVQSLIEKGNNFKKEALIQYYEAMMNRPDRTQALANSEVPVLFVIGSEDVAAPLQDLLQQVHLPKIAHIYILEEVGHMSMLEKPEKLNKHILEFINSVNALSIGR